MLPWKRAILCSHGILDAVDLLLIAAAVHHSALLGVPQCSLQGLNSLIRSVSGTSSPERLSSASSFWMVSFRVLFFSFSFSNFLFHCSAVSSRLTEAVCIYRWPNMRVDLVSASL
uniref:Secreted protein n=1 Tax=Seriola lalandi dorsalis TaxID=1841481 RepID=A0A3B4Z6B8_SERLL